MYIKDDEVLKQVVSEQYGHVIIEDIEYNTIYFNYDGYDMRAWYNEDADSVWFEESDKEDGWILADTLEAHRCGSCQTIIQEGFYNETTNQTYCYNKGCTPINERPYVSYMAWGL